MDCYLLKIKLHLCLFIAFQVHLGWGRDKPIHSAEIGGQLVRDEAKNREPIGSKIPKMGVIIAEYCPSMGVSSPGFHSHVMIKMLQCWT